MSYLSNLFSAGFFFAMSLIVIFGVGLLLGKESSNEHVIMMCSEYNKIQIKGVYFECYIQKPKKIEQLVE